MAYVPNSGSVVAFQSNPADLQASVTGVVGVSSSVAIGNYPLRTSFGDSATAPGSALNVQNYTYLFNGSNYDRWRGNSSIGGLVSTGASSVITLSQSSVAVAIVSGSIAASFTPPANQSVSGTVGSSVIGTVPVTQVTNPWIITGSVQASLTPAANQSVSGTVNVGSLLGIIGYVSTANSISSQLSTGSVFTGAWEEVKDFSAIYITVNTDTASAANGLSLQRSANASSVMTSDEYTIVAQTGRTFQIQPDARFFRVQYTNSAANQGAMALQTVYKQNYSKPSSQRPSDGYTNETDLEQMQGFNMLYNGTTWDRARGTAASGMLVYGSVYGNISGSVAAFQAGTQVTSLVSTVPSSVLVGASIFGQVPTVITSIATAGQVMGSVAALQGTNPWLVTWLSASIAGTYQEDSAHADGNRGVFNLGVRNDTIASFVGTNLDYGPIGTDSAGRTLTKPFAPGESSVIGINSIVSAGTAASVLLFPAPGTGLKNYVTDWAFSNSGTTAVVALIADSDSSILGRAIVPAGGGNNKEWTTPLVTTRTNTVVNLQLVGSSSIVYANISGFKAP